MTIRLRLLAVAMVVSACARVGPAPNSGPAPLPPLPSITDGPIAPGAEARAAELLAEAAAAESAQEWPRAAAAADEVVRQHPRAPGSSDALRILARAAFQTGDDAVAADAAARFLERLPDGDERGGAILLLRSSALERAADPAGALSALLTAPEARAALTGRDGVERVRALAREVAMLELESFVAGLPSDRHPFGAPLLLEYGIGLYFQGREAEANQYARRVIGGEPLPEERRGAQSILAGTIEAAFGASPLVGAILPESGSPRVAEVAALIRDGIDVALSTIDQSSRRAPTLEVVDDQGEPALAARSMEGLEDRDVLAVIGPLLQTGIADAARSRRGRTPIVSPTAAVVPEGLEDVYSLSAADPGAGRALARFAVRSGLTRVAIVYPGSDAAGADARAFIDGFRSVPGVEIREIPYPSGATFFRDQLEQARAFGAQALALPIPPDDVELLAPQVSFFGLDSIGIRVLGNASWGAPDVLDRVDTRHLDGVVVAAPQDPRAPGPAYGTFVERFEQVHQRTLRSPLPALGYDAALLVLAAIESGARSVADVADALGRVRDFEGATGTISIEEGRVVRRHALFVIEAGQLRSLSVDGN